MAAMAAAALTEGERAYLGQCLRSPAEVAAFVKDPALQEGYVRATHPQSHTLPHCSRAHADRQTLTGPVGAGAPASVHCMQRRRASVVHTSDTEGSLDTLLVTSHLNIFSI